MVYAGNGMTAKKVASSQRLSYSECILIDDEEHTKDLIENSADLVHVRFDTQIKNHLIKQNE